MSASIFSPDGKNFCQFMTPHSPKPRFWTKFHLGMVVVVFDLPPDPGPGPTWTRDILNLDQGRAQPGPGTGPTWTRDGPNLDQARAQPGPGTGLSLAPAHGWPTPSSEKKFPGNFFSGWGVVPESGFQGAPGWGYLDLPPSQKQKFTRNLFSGEGVADPLPRKKNPWECFF